MVRRWSASTEPGELAELARTASSNDVYLVPGFTGLGAPYWDAQAVGLISGLDFGTGLPQLTRAAMESIAFQVEDVVEAMDVAAGRIGTLLADGGASRNPTLMQIQADISGRDVYRAADADLSALGAAHLAGRTAGVWTQQDLENLPRPRDHFEPAESAQQRTRRRSGWQAAVRRARGQADKVDGPF